jgi:hypothetical protein
MKFNSMAAACCGSTAEASSYFLLDPAIKSQNDVRNIQLPIEAHHPIYLSKRGFPLARE